MIFIFQTLPPLFLHAILTDIMTKQTTRQRIVEILEELGPQTVDDLATHVGVKKGTIRHHLTALRAEGAVDVDLKRHGVGRPAHVFKLTRAK